MFKMQPAMVGLVALMLLATACESLTETSPTIVAAESTAVAEPSTTQPPTTLAETTESTAGSEAGSEADAGEGAEDSTTGPTLLFEVVPLTTREPTTWEWDNSTDLAIKKVHTGDLIRVHFSPHPGRYTRFRWYGDIRVLLEGPPSCHLVAGYIDLVSKAYEVIGMPGDEAPIQLELYNPASGLWSSVYHLTVVVE